MGSPDPNNNAVFRAATHGDKVKRSFLVSTVFIAVAVLLLVWFGRRPSSTDVSQSASEPTPSYIATPEVSPAPGSNGPRQAPLADVTPVTDLKRREELNKLESTPISFYGRVVDENNQPVRGAQTSYTVHHLTLSGNAATVGPRTDLEGRFEVHTNGPKITVSVSHPNYYVQKESEREVDYSGRTGGTTDIATRERPLLFHLRRKGEAEPLVHGRSQNIHLPLDGQPTEVLLRHVGGPKVTIALKSTSAQLPRNEFRRFDWSISISVAGGGLIERSDSLDFEAPASGYLPTVDIQMPAQLANWDSHVEKQYFLYSPDRTYSRVTFEVSGRTGIGRLEWFLNPSGSRNLEADPSKLEEGR
jgi:hypothetical protein